MKDCQILPLRQRAYSVSHQQSLRVAVFQRGYTFGFLVTLQMGALEGLFDACASTYKGAWKWEASPRYHFQECHHIRDTVSYWPGAHHLGKALWPASTGASCLCLPDLRLRVCTIPSVFTRLLGPNSSVCKASDFLTEPPLQPLESLVWRFGLGAGHVDLLKILTDDFHI